MTTDPASVSPLSDAPGAETIAPAMSVEPTTTMTPAMLAQSNVVAPPPAVSGEPAPTPRCECGHDRGSHNALRFNCLATHDGHHATRCTCRRFTPTKASHVAA